jgi:hypothetical protein
MTTERLLLADPPTGRIATTCSQSVLRSVDGACCYNITRNPNDFNALVEMFDVAMHVEIYAKARVHKVRSWHHFHLITGVILVLFRLNLSFGTFSEDEAMFIIKWLHWMLSTILGIFELYNVSDTGSPSVIGCKRGKDWLVYLWSWCQKRKQVITNG